MRLHGSCNIMYMHVNLIVLFLKGEITLCVKIIPLYIASFIGIKISSVFLRIKLFVLRIIFYI